MIPASKQARLTAVLTVGGLVILALALSSRGGPLLTAYPQFAVFTPFAITSLAALLSSAVWPVTSVVIAAAVPFYSPDVRSLGTALGCLGVGVLCTLWRRGRSAWLEPTLLATFGAVTILLSYVAPIAPPPTTRVYVVYAAFVGIAVTVIGLRPAIVLAILGALGIYASYLALTSSTLGSQRAGDVVLGQNANGLGFLCALGMVVGGVLARQGGARFRIGGALVFAVGLAGTVQSGSRGAFLAALAGVAVVVLYRYLARADAVGIGALTLAALALYFVSGPAMNWLARAAGRDTGAIRQNVTEREGATQYALHATTQHPFTGVGLAGLDEYSLFDPNASYHLSAHNVFVGRFAESGVVAGVLFLFLLGMTLVRARRRSPRTLLPLVVFLFVSGVSLDWFVNGPLSVLSFVALAAALAPAQSPAPVIDPESATSQPERSAARR